MMRRETAVIAAAAVVIGSLAALPPLIGASAGLTGGTRCQTSRRWNTWPSWPRWWHSHGARS